MCGCVVYGGRADGANLFVVFERVEHTLVRLREGGMSGGGGDE